MPTTKPRVTFTIDEKMLDQISEYQHTNRMKSQTRAIVSILDIGFKALEKEITEEEPNFPEPTPVEQALLQSCRLLNLEGQEKLIEYAADLVCTGKYKKTPEPSVGARTRRSDAKKP